VTFIFSSTKKINQFSPQTPTHPILIRLKSILARLPHGATTGRCSACALHSIRHFNVQQKLLLNLSEESLSFDLLLLRRESDVLLRYSLPKAAQGKGSGWERRGEIAKWGVVIGAGIENVYSVRACQGFPEGNSIFWGLKTMTNGGFWRKRRGEGYCF
jgi:hypothetical protein